jgi:hypothetical protein
MPDVAQRFLCEIEFDGSKPAHLARAPKANSEQGAAMAAPSQPAPLAQTEPEGVAPAAALSPESAQLLRTMARDLATVRQENEQLRASIELLKTNQEQMTRDNARAAEQFKASQEQMARDIAKASEQNLRPKISAPPPRLTATRTRKPAPSPQARAQPQDTPQPQAEPQLPSGAEAARALSPRP